MKVKKKEPQENPAKLEKEESHPSAKKIKSKSAVHKEKKSVVSKTVKKVKEPGKTTARKKIKKGLKESVSQDAEMLEKPVSHTDLPDTKKEILEKAPLQEKDVLAGAKADSLAPVLELKKEIAPEEQTVQTQTPAVSMPVPLKSKITINETISVKDLADKMSVKIGELLMRLLKMGIRATINQRLEIDTAILLANEFNFDAEFVPIYSDDAMTKEEDDINCLVPRSPIVTVMGHVDHGKTSLLDAIRETQVAEKEAGGITQHIGAYKVLTLRGQIVFLDTPGHEAFTAMRARGAQVTDLVVLVVAADDGVMPQTVEAIDHAKAAGVTIIVAVNKIDLPQSNPDRVKQELSQYQLSPEEWGGKTIFVEVSAKKRMNIDKLLEMILLEAELLELKANPNRNAQGVIIEAKLDPRKGPLATVLVQKGTLRVGNTFVCGLTSGKVKALTNDRGQRVLEVPPATPVEVLGFSETPQLGDRVIVVNSDRESRDILEKRSNLSREATIEKKRHISLEILSAAAKEGKLKELKLILKADVQGSLEALKDSIEKIETSQIRLKVIHSGVGAITESDVSLAAASDAIVIGFTVRPEAQAEEIARREGVEIKTYRIIYEVISDIRAAMSGMLEPEEKEMFLGRVDVREVFKTPQGKVAGCIVSQGKVSRAAKIRVLRDSKIIYEGKIQALRRFKDDAREVEQGYECGISLENFQDFNKNDILEAFIMEKQTRKLEA
ncbi:MAG: translation initiation factor IF-2 [Elusimicrobia bacterium RIFCSPLOWO2_02_FULL_39_32]|nr:MAG: translation initiation factor IF-2 [Elusimicrobia bacterium RIFCSPHIGHO2_02_FULL_39_36]OGR92040.1 MAG: translation initiation factor IF-2 [Elusimicrobia bacterium RIFCSPLOWO2_02_FULL_39_32]OGR98669.1 MAG: translation initiation factor IF-2 [Elusimicrobia bacterium RIFCSPLOWO2_12_FULL_39_28]